MSLNCLARLSQEITGQKAAKAAQEPEKAPEVAENTEEVKAEQLELKAEEPKKKAIEVGDGTRNLEIFKSQFIQG